jgi:hypothetical protein
MRRRGEMQRIGRIDKTDLAEMRQRGMQPKDALDAILTEARARHPKATSVHIIKGSAHDGFDIIAL